MDSVGMIGTSPGHADEEDYNVFSRTCPSRPTLEHITGRWGSLVLSALADGPLRFNELGRRVDGVSQKMLSQSVHALERDGFVDRHVVGSIPPHVEYSLTPLGEQTAGHLLSLIAHLEALMPDVLAARRRYDDGAESAR